MSMGDWTFEKIKNKLKLIDIRTYVRINAQILVMAPLEIYAIEKIIIF